MIRQYFGILITSASAERLFRITGRVYGGLHQRMKPEMLDCHMDMLNASTGRNDMLNDTPLQPADGLGSGSKQVGRVTVGIGS